MEEESKDQVPASNQDAGPDQQIETASNQQVDQEMVPTEEVKAPEEQVKMTEPNPHGFFADTSDANACSVRVAVRIRPLIGKELRERSAICVEARESENQIIMGKDRAFTFDMTFGLDSEQEDVFNKTVKNLVLGCFLGFNATILAYGQTGSGKTFTMGSGYTIGVKEEELGLIPRVIRMIFDEKEARKDKCEIIIKCSFLEIYNEELHDLLERNMSNTGMVNQIMPAKKEINIREEKNGTISVYGLKEMTVNSVEEMAGCLDMGSSQRVTACTLMNSSSSRSHGIFTISIEQHMIEDLLITNGQQSAGDGGKQEKSDEYMMAKFHFVDLAGSERAKSTGATGEQFKEGVNINKGLLALGNVISSLTDPTKSGHVPYRDSKLTRILQDSLGGNSRTVMIAACSPAECNFNETLNTLKYASRARNIKNKPVVNRDPASQMIAQLRQMVYELQKELLGTRTLLRNNQIHFEQKIELPEAEALEKMGNQIQSSNKAMGIVPMQGSGGGGGADPAEVKRLEQQVQELKASLSSKDKELKSQLGKYETLNDQHQSLQISNFELQKDRDFQKYSLEELVKALKERNIFEEIVKKINGGVLPQQSEDGVQIFDTVFGNAGPTILEEYQRKVDETAKELSESQLLLSQMQSDNKQLIEQGTRDTKTLENKEIELESHRRQISRLTTEMATLKEQVRQGKAGGSQKSNSMASSRRGSSMVSNPGMLKRNPAKHQSTALDTSRWLNDDFEGVKIKNFDEMRENFIEDLTNQFSDLLVPNSRAQSAKLGPTGLPLIQEGGALGGDQEMVDEQYDHPEEKKSVGSDISPIHSDDESDDDMIPDEKPEADIGDQTAMENDLLANIQAIESEEKQLNEQVVQKEALLDKIKQQQKEMQDVLLKEMREEYHKKISLMVDEIKVLESQKNQTLQKSTGNAQKGRIEEQFKQKSEELKLKLKELEKKQREQTQLNKALNQQKQKTKQMETEIDRMKTARVQMMKKLKEENETKAQLKKQQAKTQADLKRKLQKQQRELDVMKRAKTKADIQAKRKHEEVIAMQKRAKADQQKRKDATKVRQKSKQIDTDKIREWIIENTEKMVDYQFMQLEKIKEQNQCTMIESKIEEESKQYAKLTVQCDKLLQREGRLQLAPEGTSDDEIFQTKQDILEIQTQITLIRENITSLEEEQGFVHAKITQRSKQLIEVRPQGVDTMVFADINSLEGARACIGTFFQLNLDSNLQLREQYQEIDELKGFTESLSSSIKQMQLQMQQEERQKQLELNSLHQDYVEKERMLVQLILQKTNINIDFDANNATSEQMDNINLLDLIDLFIKQVKASNDSQYELLNEHEKEVLQNSKSDVLKKAVNAKLENREAKKDQYNATKAALAKRNAELEKKQLESQYTVKRIEKQLDNANQDKAKFKRMYEEEKRKKLKDEDGAQNATGPSHSLKDQRAARKLAKAQAGVPSVAGISARGANQKDTVPSINDINMIRKSHSEMSGDVAADDQDNSDVFRRLQERSGRHRGRTPKRQGGNDSSFMFKNSSTDADMNWKMVHDRHDAHKTQVYAMTSVGNQLYSAAARSLRIWDVNTMQLLSDLPDKIGVVKAIAFWKERNLLMTAAEKNIMLWDVVSLTNVGMIKGYKEEIKSLRFEKQLLFAASKGTSQSGGLLVYDLRKSHNNPLYEREKQQDVFSLTSTGSHVFYGCRNHSVYPFCLSTFNTLQGLQPPHFDAVTSLAMLNNGSTLVSGSRDKNLRLYDLTQPNFPELSSQLNAHNDHINTLETDENQSLLYSGSRDGIVRVWQQQQSDLQLMATLEGNAQHQSINTICKLNASESAGSAFAVGSTDKSIRIYSMSEQAAEQSRPHDVVFNQAVDTQNQNVEMRDETQMMPPSFTAAQMDQLQELERMRSNFSGATDQQQQPEESGALSQLRRRKQQKQAQQQNSNL